MTFDAVKLLGLLGGVAGAITLVWRIIDVFKAYLHIPLPDYARHGTPSIWSTLQKTARFSQTV